VYRTTGGVLDFYAFLGPEPENVIQQYTHVSLKINNFIQNFNKNLIIVHWSKFHATLLGIGISSIALRIQRFRRYETSFDEI
jgi:hypothetical protein